jgi:hypothetical protein
LPAGQLILEKAMSPQALVIGSVIGAMLLFITVLGVTALLTRD